MNPTVQRWKCAYDNCWTILTDVNRKSKRRKYCDEHKEILRKELARLRYLSKLHAKNVGCVSTTIMLTKTQRDFIEKNVINLTKFVQDKLDVIMNDQPKQTVGF